MNEKTDFVALRAKRNEQIREEVARLNAEGWNIFHNPHDDDDCYCDCAAGGPCEHDFQGWREFEDGRGGEQVCTRCGTGAMRHSLATSW